MPLSTQVTSMPSIASRTLPVGSRLPVADPSVSVNASTTGAAVPGTPAMATSPRYSTRPSGVGKVATAMLSELTMRIRTLVSGVLRGHQPAFDGERADPGEDVAAVLPVADRGLVHPELQEQVVDVGVGVLRRADDGDLAGQRGGAAEPVDLAGVGRAHQPQQQVVAGGRVGRQVARLEVQPARGAAAQHRGSARRCSS